MKHRSESLIHTRWLAAFSMSFGMLAVASDSLAKDGELAVVLRGTAEFEAAPHGQGNVYAPEVHIDNSIFRMWYGAQGEDGHDRILYAESRDGMTWVRKGVVLEDDKANQVNDPSIVEVAGSYYMYYTRAAEGVVDTIWVATSKQGMYWKTIGPAIQPGKSGRWDSLSVGRPAVLHENGVFKMWYDGRKDLPLEAPADNVSKSAKSRRSVGYATSTDGVHWSKHDRNPVFGDDAGGVDVTRVGSRLVLTYESRTGVRMAVSDDGIDWSESELLIPTSGKPMDRFGHVTPHLLVSRNGDEAMVYIGAASVTTWDRNIISLARRPARELQRRINLLADKAVAKRLADGSAWSARLKPQLVADRVVAEFMQREKIRPNYTNDLTLEALLAMYDATGDRKYLDFVNKVLSERRMPPNGFPPYRSQPFNCITISLFERTAARELIEPYIAEMNRYRRTAPRSFDGAVSHFGDPKMGRILIDQLQDYSARMARAGWLSGDESFNREAIDQYRLFRDALRDPKTGLWGHGRGWYDDPRSVTATPWGRGHGWLIKGFVETLAYLPQGSDESRQMRLWLDDFARSLLKHQDEQGMWRQVVDRPDSYAETSSTALISYYFARAIRHGYLDEATFHEPAINAYEGLLKHSVAADGTVYRTCRGTGPQRTVEDYLVRETPVNDQHGIAAVIFACAGRLLIDGPGTLPPHVKRYSKRQLQDSP